MKTLLTSVMLLLLMGGCLSPSKSSYTTITQEQYAQKLMRNEKSRDYVWNKWRYAGSDDKYDYIYEYTPGSVIPYGFHCYKIPRGNLAVSVRYDFDPSYGNNQLIF